jgi:hypothetical protein
MRESMLHPEFADLQGQVHYVQERIRGREWSSSCPKCGGEPHPHGEFPDRFRMWISASSKRGITIGWCRVCDFKWTPRREYKPDPAKIEEWRQERIAEEVRRKAEAEVALCHLRDEHKWQTYYQTLTENQDGQSHWWGAGFVNEFWWGEWGFGYDPAHEFWYDDGGWKKHVTDTMTIPVRNMLGEIVNIKHRLINPMPDRSSTRYRMEYRVGIEPVFIANLEKKNDAEVVWLVEGEKKAGITFIAYDNPSVQILGLPKSPSDELLQSINGKKIYYVPDPDVAPKWRNRIIQNFSGRDVRVVEIVDKIDDWIIRNSITKENLQTLAEQARRIR